MSKQDVKRTERGWAGHFICGHQCRFHRNTLLESEHESIVVSTVGNYHPRGRVEIDTIGHLRYYETMAFHTKQDGPYIEMNVEDPAEFDSPWSIDAGSVEALPLDVDNVANDMHETVVAEIMGRMK